MTHAEGRPYDGAAEEEGAGRLGWSRSRILQIRRRRAEDGSDWGKVWTTLKEFTTALVGNGNRFGGAGWPFVLHHGSLHRFDIVAWLLDDGT